MVEVFAVIGRIINHDPALAVVVVPAAVVGLYAYRRYRLRERRRSAFYAPRVPLTPEQRRARGID